LELSGLFRGCHKILVIKTAGIRFRLENDRFGVIRSINAAGFVSDQPFKREFSANTPPGFFAV